MSEVSVNDEIYGKLLDIKRSLGNPNVLVITIERDVPVKTEFLDYLNSKYGNKDIGLDPRILFNYRKFKRDET